MSDALLTERRDRVLVITINRPEQRNAVNNEVADGLVAAFAELDESDDLTVGVLTGAGGSFCAGMDLKAFATEGPPAAFGTALENGARKPLIAALEGYVLAGGLELALTCDLLVAGEETQFGVPEVKRGLLAAGGALIRLPSRIPYAKAMELALTGDRIGAPEALELGLLNEVVPAGASVMDAALALADRIAVNAPLSIAASKQVIQASIGRTEEDCWKIQAPLVGTIFSSKDAMEGSIAFAERRDPNWSGA